MSLYLCEGQTCFDWFPYKKKTLFYYFKIILLLETESKCFLWVAKDKALRLRLELCVGIELNSKEHSKLGK